MFDRRWHLRLLAAAVAAGMVLCSTGLAQAPAASEEGGRKARGKVRRGKGAKSPRARPARRNSARGLGGMSPMDWNVDWLLKMTADNVARHYKLTTEQADVAREMISTRTKIFLGEHEQETRELFTEMWDVRMKRKTPTAASSKEWSVRAQPLFQRAKTEILEGNEVFAEYLTDEQRKGHTGDMGKTRVFFGQLDERLDNWKEGKFDPNDPWIGGGGPRKPGKTEGRRPARGGGQRGRRAAGGNDGVIPPILQGASSANIKQLTQAPDIPVVAQPTHKFDEYVEKFIKHYELEEAQCVQVRAIAKDSRDRAIVSEMRKADQLEQLSREMAAIGGSSPAQLKRKARLEERWKKLIEPITRHFEYMIKKLSRIPTAAQRKAAAKKPPISLEEPGKGDKGPQPAAAKKPAKPRPAAKKPAK